MTTKWPTRLRRKLAEAGNPRARQEAEHEERNRWLGHFRDIVRASAQLAAEMLDRTGLGGIPVAVPWLLDYEEPRVSQFSGALSFLVSGRGPRVGRILR